MRRRKPKILAMVLAGGEGRRLYPLTRDRAKPAVPIGGRYRLIDFVLSNFVNSGIFKIKVLTQFKSHSLNDHLSRGWRLSAMLDHYVAPVPAMINIDNEWFKGSADAIYKNLNVITDEKPDYVCVFGADHIYKMDVSQMIDEHREKGAELTVAAIPVPIEEATAFGVIEVDDTGKMIGFEEKPEHPKPIPGNPSMALASMGNYVFNTDALIREVKGDADKKDSAHDFGKSIVTNMWPQGRTYVYDFSRNEVPGQEEKERGYWRDVGSIEAYWRACMDLVDVTPIFSLYNEEWPIRTVYDFYPPAKFVWSDEVTKRMGIATDSLVSEGCIISGGHINRSILSPNVRINSFSYVTESIIFNNSNIGRYAKIRRAIIDKNVKIAPHVTIGYDLEADRKRFFVSESGIVVIPKGTVVEA